MRAKTPTPRQIEILELLAKGMTSVEIGNVIYITDDTVKSHLRRLYQTFELRNAAHACATAVRERWIR